MVALRRRPEPLSRPHAEARGRVSGQAELYLAVCNTYGFTQGPFWGLLVAEAVLGRKSSRRYTGMLDGEAYCGLGVKD